MIMIPRIAALCVMIVLLTGSAFAQQPPNPKPTRMSATVEKLEGGKLAVKTEEGDEIALTLPADAKVFRNRPATMAEVKQGEFIGCTAVQGPDGKLYAQEIHILPESMRGVGEGHYPWGDAPNTTMTNGNIEQLAGITDGHVIKVSYKGGQSEIEIPPNIELTAIEPAEKDALTPGAKIVVFADKAPDGSWTARYVRVGK